MHTPLLSRFRALWALLSHARDTDRQEENNRFTGLFCAIFVCPAFRFAGIAVLGCRLIVLQEDGRVTFRNVTV